VVRVIGAPAEWPGPRCAAVGRPRHNGACGPRARSTRWPGPLASPGAAGRGSHSQTLRSFEAAPYVYLIGCPAAGAAEIAPSEEERGTPIQQGRALSTAGSHLTWQAAGARIAVTAPGGVCGCWHGHLSFHGRTGHDYHPPSHIYRRSHFALRAGLDPVVRPGTDHDAQRRCTRAWAADPGYHAHHAVIAVDAHAERWQDGRLPGAVYSRIWKPHDDG